MRYRPDANFRGRPAQAALRAHFRNFRWSDGRLCRTIEHVFDEAVMLTDAEYDAFVIACLETDFDQEYPDPADFVDVDWLTFAR